MKKYKLTINQKEYETKIVDYSDSRAIVKVNGHEYEVNIAQDTKAVTQIVRSPKKSPDIEMLSSSGKKAAVVTPGTVVSPIPGLVLSINVKVGDTVAQGDTIIILEAMKMESEIASTAAGTVKKILVKEQQSIQENDPIIEVG
ncbi:MAG: biotin/lipoyl-binding protein [Candidatus Cloacimonetes bacterium]|nr:biotin/lipoyl-binding protein [Candidatus Cloacimonadota bacterium]